jgi:hypothetical protein
MLPGDARILRVSAKGEEPVLLQPGIVFKSTHQISDEAQHESKGTENGFQVCI